LSAYFDFNTILPVLIEWLGVIGITMLLALSPAFKRKPLIFKYPQREGIVASVLYAILIGGLAFLFTQANWVPNIIQGAANLHLPVGWLMSGLGSQATPATIITYTQDDILRQLTVSALSLAPFALVLLVRQQPLLSVGLGQQTLRPSLTLGVSLGLMTIFLRGKIYTLIYSMGATQVNYLLAMAGVGLAEEIIFRGFIQLRLTSWLGPVWGWVLTAFAFAIYHIPSRLIIEHVSLEALAFSLVMPLLFGLIQGWIMQKSGNIAGLAIYHAIHNWMAVL
jgi:membrane protease YdiL (CAAX protease family)